MQAQNAVVVRERLGQRWRNGHGYDGDDRLDRRLGLAIGCETAAIRVPALKWPSDLFVDCQASEAEVTI